MSQNIKNSAITSKAGILLACAIIPTAEYTLSFAKNLFTLKTFKKSNFDNIANLDKTNNIKEDAAQQKRVEQNSINQLKKAGLISAIGLISGLALAKYGSNSPKAIKFSKALLEPGKTLCNKLNIKDERAKNVLKSLNLDFANNKGKLALSKGQLALTAILGLFGYSKAASDRGKLDVAEVWTRVPLVVFYTIFGSELFETGFIKALHKNNKFPDLIKENSKGKLTIPSREQLPKIASELSKKSGLSQSAEFKKLLKQKAITTGVPYLFSLLFMGFSLSAITRLWTQYRYNHQNKDNFGNKNQTT